MASDTSPAKLLIPASEAAALLSISPRTLWSLTAPRRPIRVVRLQGRVLFSTDYLRRWIDEMLNQADAGPSTAADPPGGDE